MTGFAELAFRVPLWLRLGDLALAVVLLPVAIATLGIVPLVVALGTGLLSGEDEAQALWAGAAMGAALLVAIVALFQPPIWWSVRLTRDRLILGGPLLRRRVPYEEIRMIRAGSAHRWRPYGATRVEEGHLLVDAGWPKRFRVQLAAGDAHACLVALHERSPHAVAVDSHGREYLPRAPSSVSRGRRRLGRLWLGGGLAAVLGGALFCPLGLAVLGQAITGRRSLADVLDALLLLAMGLGMLGFGWTAIVRGRRHTLLSSRMIVGASSSGSDDEPR